MAERTVVPCSCLRCRSRVWAWPAVMSPFDIRPLMFDAVGIFERPRVLIVHDCEVEDAFLAWLKGRAGPRAGPNRVV